MTERYFALARACDDILLRPEATLEWTAIPWLHMLSQHPSWLENYTEYLKPLQRTSPGLLPRLDRVGRPQLALVRDIFQSAAARRQEFDLSRVDVLIVSWLVHAGHLNSADDFYFGDLQSRLARRGLRSLLVLRNQTGRPASELLPTAVRKGERARMMFTDVPPLPAELSLIGRCARAGRMLLRLSRNRDLPPLVRHVAREAGTRAISTETAQNLELNRKIAELCRHTSPRLVLTLYEGHAWERCLWHAVRTSNSRALCAGYQHTNLREHAHATKRSLGRGKLYDPDVVLTLGEVTRKVLSSCQSLSGTQLITYGTHRQAGGAAKPNRPKHGGAILVLPEGVVSECVRLFTFAIEAARLLPDVPFIFRNHPVLPFDRVRAKLPGVEGMRNIEISTNPRLEDDLERAGSLLYRGSSSAIYAVRAGLKPYYVTAAGEMNIDPLYELSAWRERAASPPEFVLQYKAHQSRRTDEYSGEWQAAREYCEEYTSPVRDTAIDEVLKLAGIEWN